MALTALPPSRAAFDDRYSQRTLVPIHGDLRYITIMNGHVVTNKAAIDSFLDKLLEWNYTTITLDDLYLYLATGATSHLPAKPLILTWDDGGLSQYQYAFPSLVERGMKGTFYLVPQWMDDVIGNSTFLETNHFTWANAVEMKAAGMDFQSHGYAHLDYGLTFNTSGAVADFLAAKARIEAMIPGQTVSHMAFPYGSTTTGVRAQLATETQLKTARTVTLTDGSTEYVTHYNDRLWLPTSSGSHSWGDIAQANVYGLLERNPQLMPDAGFNAGALGWTLGTGFAVDTSVKHAGTKSLKCVQQTTTVSTSTTQRIPIGYWGGVNGGIWIKTDQMPASSVKVQMQLLKIDGSIYLTPDYVTTGGTQDWTKFTWTYRGDWNVYAVKPILWSQGAASPVGTVWFDDSDLRRIPRAPGNPVGF